MLSCVSDDISNFHYEMWPSFDCLRFDILDISESKVWGKPFEHMRGLWKNWKLKMAILKVSAIRSHCVLCKNVVRYNFFSCIHIQFFSAFNLTNRVIYVQARWKKKYKRAFNLNNKWAEPACKLDFSQRSERMIFKLEQVNVDSTLVNKLTTE